MSRARDLAGIFNLNPLSGTTAQRPASAEVGEIYYNGTTGKTQIYTPTGWQDMASGISYGNTAGRPTPETGKLYSNGETARLELYTQASGWQNIVQETPGVASISGTYLESVGSGTITISGTNFVSGCYATAIGTNGAEVNASSTTFNSIVQVTASFTGLSSANEPYDIKITNPSNLFGVIPDILYVNNNPTWTTAAGSLGTFDQQTSVSVSAVASDDSTITYSLASGSSLPSGVTLNSSTGLISGTLPAIDSDTTYTFTINVSDGSNPAVPRTFNITSLAVLEKSASILAYFDFANGRSWNGTSTLVDLSGRGKNLPKSNANYSSSSGGILTTSSEQSMRSTGLVGSISEISMGVWVKLDGSTNRGIIYYGDTSNNNHFFIRDGIMGAAYNFDVGKDINGGDTWTPSKYNGSNVRNYITGVSDYANKYWFYVVRVNSSGIVTTSLNGSNFETTVNAGVSMSGHSSGQFGIAGDPYNDNASNHTYGGAWWYQGLVSQSQVTTEWNKYRDRFGW